MPVPPSTPHSARDLILATPDQLDSLAEQAAAVGRRVEELAVCAGAVLRDLAVALPGSATARAAPGAGRGCVELLHAEGAALRALGQAFSAAAQTYREGDAGLANRLLAGAS